MSAMHTPGPWTTRQSRLYSNEILLVDASGKWIGNLRHNDDLPSEVQKANAALIAVTPCLLEALIDAADALAIHAPNSWVLTQALATIAKVKGGAA